MLTAIYNDGRFAKHNRFRYFALNTDMRWRAFQTGRVYIRQNLEDGLLFIDEFRDMAGRKVEHFSNRVLRYASSLRSLRGNRQYWFQQRSKLFARLIPLICQQYFLHTVLLIFTGQSSDSEEFNQREAEVNNPAIADWYFYHRVQKFD